MPRVKLTQKAVDALKAPDPSKRQTLHWDTELRGFGVLCSGVSNTKTYIVQRDLPNGRTRRVTIGAANVFKLDRARTEAELVLADMYKGIDPKQGRRGSATLSETLAAYLAARKDLAEKSRLGYKSTVETYLAPWLDRPLREITPEMVEDQHREIKQTIEAREDHDQARRAARLLLQSVKAEDPPAKAAVTNLKRVLKDGDASAIRRRAATLAAATGTTLPDPPTMKNGNATANAAMRVLRILWNFAIERDASMPANPVRRLRRQWYEVRRRERLVRAEELPRFYEAVMKLPNPVARDYLLLLLFTGLRREEAASLTWEDIDFAERIIRLPAKRTKAGRKLDLPMTDYVRDLLIARRSIGKEKFVFPSDSKGGYIAEPKFPLGLVAEACGVSVSAHDLRRTFITVAEGADISPIALKALVNHALGSDVTSGYIVMTAERLREPAQRVCDRMRALCGAEPAESERVRRIQ